ncbi:MAG TPA: hypothetical protein VMR99_01415, partial [Candidatus Paceibacterota bacterium]|nr:hypothetical protein [Candidatus Paceibacterota bacterium]
KLLLDKEGKRNMTDGVIQFIEPDDRGKMHREEFAITPGEVKVLEKLVMDVAREILDLSFWNKGCHESDCKYCELRKGMKFTQATGPNSARTKKDPGHSE